MKTVLVTGGAGFIAHHLVKHLLETTDYNVVSLDRLDFSGNLNRLSDILKDRGDKHRVRVVFHDLRAEVNPLLEKKIGHVDYIVHMAAGTHVDRSIEDPMEFVWDNVVATGHLLQYARRIKPEKVLYFSTDEVFGPAPEGVKYREDDRYHSGNPYAATKAGGEELAVSFQNTYGLPVLVSHTMNVFGYRQHPEKFIPKTISDVLAGQTVPIHANATKTKSGSRFYIYAMDVADAVSFLIKNGKAGEKYNIVGAEEVSNLDLAQKIAGIVGKPLKYDMVDFHSSRPGHDLRYALDGQKMADMGWKPRPIDTTLPLTVKWYLDNPEWLSVPTDCPQCSGVCSL